MMVNLKSKLGFFFIPSCSKVCSPVFWLDLLLDRKLFGLAPMEKQQIIVNKIS